MSCCYLLPLAFLAITGCLGRREEADCLPWETHATNESRCVCRDDLGRHMQCRNGVAYLDVDYCLTYNESTLYAASCPFIRKHGFDANTTSIKVPTNLSEINDFFCSPLNRKGLLCSECEDGYGVSLLTVGLKCAKCTSPMRDWILYFVVQFLPVTIFYLFILMLQVSVTSAPMNYFILYSQITVLTFGYDMNVLNGIYSDSPPLLQKIFTMLLTLYEPWNLAFGTYILPDFCVSPSIKNVHIFLFQYVPAIYFLILIVLTYLIFKLDKFQCQFRVAQKCLQLGRFSMSGIRALANPQASIIDVLATLFILSYTRIATSSFLTFRHSSLKNMTAVPPVILHKLVTMDPSYAYLSRHNAVYMVIAATMFSILVAIFFLLACYPFKGFRKLLGCTIRSTKQLQYLNMLVEKLQGHYKDGTNGSRDLRVFSVLHLLLRIALPLTCPEIHVPGPVVYIARGLVLLACSLLVLVVRPYKTEHLSSYDGLVLGLLGIQAIMVNLKLYFTTTNVTWCLWILAITAALPQLALIAYTLKVVAQFLVRKCSHRSVGINVRPGFNRECASDHYGQMRDHASDHMSNPDHKRVDTNTQPACETESTPLL